MSTNRTPPTWAHEPADNAYPLISGDVRCRVWHMLGSWQPIVSHRGAATTGYIQDRRGCLRLV